jgi:VPDSG-CTERM exosortase interaction domain
MTTRKHVFYGILALVSLLGLGITQSARANLITNGGFETGDFSGWTVLGTDNLVEGSVPLISPHSGSSQAQFGINTNSITQNVATTPGSSYVIRFFLAAKIFNQVDGAFSVSWGALTGTSGLTPPGIHPFTEFTFTVPALSPTTALQFQFSDPNITSNTYYLDDISVNPVGVGVPDAGSTLPLLGFALLGLVASRRKLRC